MVCRPIKPPELSETVKQRMQNGRENEIHAIATLASKFLPAFEPDLGYVEEGCYMESYQNEPFVVVSPDGSCRNIFDQEKASFGLEIKCSFPGKTYTTLVFYHLPTYYVIQVLCEMHVLKTNTLFFMSYTTESSTILQVTFDMNYEKSFKNKKSHCV